MDYYLISYGLTFIAMIITLSAQFFINSTYKKYSKIKNERGISGAEAARYILDKNGLNEIEVVETSGYLSDHYDSKNKVIRLSSSVYHDATISSVAVACHECGHAIQDKEGYIFMKIRSIIIPLVNFSSYAGYIAIVLGIIFGAFNLIWLGILAEVVILLFELVTLPVEFDASKKGLKELDYSHFFKGYELNGGKKVLIAAAMTYVAGVASTLLEIFRLVLMFGRRED